MQNKKKNILSLSLIVALLAVIVGGTYAYFTDDKEVTNTFTVGDVKISLNEAPVERIGNGWFANDEVPRVDGVTYENIYPGAELPKDPTVRLVAGSEDSYVYMQLQNNAADYLDKIVINEDWSLLPGSTNVYVYNNIVTTENTTSTPPLFSEVKVKKDLNKEKLNEIEELDITVKAFAIQAVGLEDAQNTANAEALKHFSE